MLLWVNTNAYLHMPFFISQKSILPTSSKKANMHGQDSAREGSSVGCTINGIPPQNIFSQGGCNTVIHHCFQTEWEYHHYQQQLHSSTDCKQVAECPLVKRCMLHHLLGHLAVKKLVLHLCLFLQGMNHQTKKIKRPKRKMQPQLHQQIPFQRRET